MKTQLVKILFRGIGPNTKIHYGNAIAKNGDIPEVDVDFAEIMYSSGYAIPFTEKDLELVVRRENADNAKIKEIGEKVASLDKGGK